MDIVSRARWAVGGLGRDVRLAMRVFRRAPGYAATAVLVIALGVGATTAAFTLADHVLLRPLPFPDADRLLKVLEGPVNRDPNLRGPSWTNEASAASYLAWKQAASAFDRMGAYARVSVVLAGSGGPELVEAASTTWDTLATVGIAPALGRPFTAEDDVEGAACVVLVSDGLWQSRFGGDRSAVGQTLIVDDESCLIVGVMPRGFQFPWRTTRLWQPIRFAANVAQTRGNRSLTAIGRLRPGASFEQARGELIAASAALNKLFPDDERASTAVVMRLRDEIGSQARMLLLALVGAAGCVLLIACTNLASLLVARSTARTRELAVRRALGAGRLHLVRQFLAETLMLTCSGGALGVVIGMTALPTIVRLVPVALPIPEVPSADLRMLAIAAVLTLVTGVIAGVAPALRASGRADLAALRDGARVGPTRRTERLRAGLVIAQVSVSVVLLVAAGLLLRALWRVQATPTGFSTDRVLTLRTMLPFARYGPQAPRVEFYRQVLAQVAALPGVSAVAYTSYLPLTMRGGIWPVTAPGVAAGNDAARWASARYITPDYFKAMQIPLRLGRPFDDSDFLTALPTAIVSDEFALRYLDGRTPIGEQFQFGPSGVRTIVGVVGDVRVRGLEQRSEPQVYLPYEQQRDNTTLGYLPKDLVVKIDAREDEDAAMARLATSIRQIVARVDSRQPISDVRPLADIVSGETSTREVQVRVLGAFAAVACVLAAVGLHGLLAFVVSMRAREFGVRLALGAEPRTILALVGRRVALLAAVGVLTGAGAGYAAGRWMSSLLAGVSPGDPITFGISVTAMLVTAFAGGIMPAVRAARTSPTAALASD